MSKEFEELIGEANDKPLSVAGHRERVRENVERNPDFTGFADYELLEYLLFATIPRKDTKPLAKELIRTFGSLSSVLHADYYELMRVDGVGEKTAHLLSHVLPIVVRAEYSRFNGMRVDTPLKSAQFMYSRFMGKNKEKLIMASLNLNDEVIQTDAISDGAIDSAPVDIMKILRVADRNGAKKIILAHNHPGGTMNFSDTDMEMTSRVVSCCMLTGIIFVDHFIFCDNRYISMFGNDMLSAALTLCDGHNMRLTQALTRERTIRSMITKIKESGESGDSYSRQMEILDAYREIFRLNSEEYAMVMNYMSKTLE